MIIECDFLQSLCFDHRTNVLLVEQIHAVVGIGVAEKPIVIVNDSRQSPLVLFRRALLQKVAEMIEVRFFQCDDAIGIVEFINLRRAEVDRNCLRGEAVRDLLSEVIS